MFKNVKFVAAEENGMQPTPELIAMTEKAVKVSKDLAFREKDILSNVAGIELEQHGAYKCAVIYGKDGNGFQILIDNVYENGRLHRRAGEVTN
jgi:hypothetical protein